MNRIIRAATPADAEAIAHVHVAGWRWAYNGLMPAKLLDGLSITDRTQQWQRQVGAPGAGVFVGEAGGEILGFVSCGQSRDADGHGEVYAMYLKKEVQGAGLGAELWREARDWLAGQGFATVKVWVLDTNVLARGFYERSGLELDGGTKSSEWAGARLNEVSYLGPLT